MGILITTTDTMDTIMDMDTPTMDITGMERDLLNQSRLLLLIPMLIHPLIPTMPTMDTTPMLMPTTLIDTGDTGERRRDLLSQSPLLLLIPMLILLLIPTMPTMDTTPMPMDTTLIDTGDTGERSKLH